MSLEEIESLRSGEPIPGKYFEKQELEGLEGQPVTLENVRKRIKSCIDDNEPDMFYAIVAGMSWVMHCCPGVFTYRVWPFDPEGRDGEEIGVFFDFRDSQPTPEQMEDIALLRGETDMRFTGMTEEWKYLVACHVVDLMGEAFGDSEYKEPVSFLDASEPGAMLLEPALGSWLDDDEYPDESPDESP